MNLIIYSNEEAERNLAHGAVLCTAEQLDNYYLMHYRRGGERKGVRRYQDENGNYTPLGYRHYAEMYGWNKRVAKADRLNDRANQAENRRNDAVRKVDDAFLRADQANAKAAKKNYWERSADRASANLANVSQKAATADARSRLATQKAESHRDSFRADWLQKKADKATAEANKAQEAVNAAQARNEAAQDKALVRTTSGLTGMMNRHRQAQAEKANAALERAEHDRDVAEAQSRVARNEADAYIDKLDRKAEKMSRYTDETGDLTEEAQNKYTYTTGLPGERKMSLIGRMKFGNEYSNKFNEQHKSNMNKNQQKEWADSEKAEFDRQNEEEKALAERARKVATLDDVHNRVMAGMDDLSPKERAKLGDQILSTIGESSKLFDDANSRQGDDYINFTGLQNWLIDEVYDKAGSINASDYKPGTNAEKAEEKANSIWEKQSALEDKIKAANGFKTTDSAYLGDAKQRQKLRAVLEKDSTWKQLDVEYDKALSDVMGAILKDLGFNDTPANRSLLYAYGWWD